MNFVLLNIQSLVICMVDVDVTSTRLQTVLLEIQKEKEAGKIELTENKLGFSMD